jgi:trigger factor
LKEYHLKIETENRDDHQIKIVAESDEATLETFKQKASRKISNESKIPGFRPGKAPYTVIRRIYGDEVIQKQAIEMMIDDIYPKLIEETKVKPYGPGSLEKIESEVPPKFSFLVPLEPVVELKDFHGIRQEYVLPVVSDKDVEDYLERVRKTYATAEPVERSAEKGDLVYLKLKGTGLNPETKKEEELIKDTPLQMMIEDTTFGENDFPFKDFDQKLIGVKANEEQKLDYDYPADFADPKLAGKTVHFTFTIQSIKFMKLPEVNDELAKMVGGFENADALKAAIRKQLEGNAKSEYERKYFDELIEKISKDATVKYPPQALEDEIEHVLNSIRNDLASQKMDLETYLKTIKKEKDTFIKEDVTPVAIKRLTQSLIFEEIAHKENIKLDEKELNNAFSQTIQELQVTSDFQKMQRKLSPQRLSNAIAMQAANRLMSNHVLDRLKEIATGEFEKKEAEEKSKTVSAETNVETSKEPVSEKPKASKKPKGEKTEAVQK